ncbi:ATP-binding protein [Falsirhodobacter deserti]|uniref:ATP-binding protein n=1 Tax=Falsirhodobacter deserti TaxID=1365611 RepID=UPI000FE36489|nr:ATP-binding protein [Falsirhodobacter deserti]
MISQQPADLAFLNSTQSAVGAKIAAHDWRNTDVGPIETWPLSLRTTLGIMLACPSPMFLAWGPNLVSFYNDAYEPLLGYRAPDALGKPFRHLWDIIWDDISPLVEDTLQGRSRKMVDMPLDIARNGQPEESYWTFSYSPALDDAGQIAGVFGVINETTDRVLAHRNRTLSDERLHLALSAGNSIGTWDWDLLTNLVTADIRFATLYGVDPEKAASGASVDEFFSGIHPADLQRVRAEIEAARVGSGVFVSEYRLARPDGGTRWVSAQGRFVKDADGRAIRLPGASLDITNRKLMELELRAAKEEREFVVDLLAHQRTLSDPDAIIRHASQALGERLGVHRTGFYRLCSATHLRHSDAWITGSLSALEGEHPVDQFGTYAAHERQEGRILAFSDSRHDADGRLVPYSANGVLAAVCVPLMTGERWSAGFYMHHAEVRHWTDAEIALAKEIATQTWLAVERAEAQLRLAQWVDLQDAALLKGASKLQEQQARRKAAEDQVRHLQKMEAVGQLTGGIAHDFNNMLAIIISGLNLTQRKLRSGNIDVQDFLEGAMEGAQRAASLTQRLLAFARQQPLTPEVINVNALISNLTDLLVRSLGETVELRTELADGLWNAQVDPGQLENAIVNLAVNARDAMPTGGQVLIATRNVDIDAVLSVETGLDAGPYIRITVTDTGSGMSSETLSRAFEPFFTTKSVGKGTGLGLSQVFGFIHQSGGKVQIDSEVGRGTTITLFLPRNQGELQSASSQMPDDRPYYGRADELILVVEDEEQVRHFSVEALRELGYTVTGVGSGAEALNIIEQRDDIALLFTDVVMPEMTGRQLAERASALRPGLRVLFTSGYTRNTFAEAEKISGQTDLLPKPFTMDELASRIRSVLDR